MSLLGDFIDSSFNATADSLAELVERVIDRLKFEREKCSFENFRVKNRLIEIDPVCDVLVVGDIHGDLDSLVTILAGSGFLKNMRGLILFLGDYGDRGDFSIEVYNLILKLKFSYPDQIVLLRGNHELSKDLMVYPHDLPDQLRSKFGGGWRKLYSLLLVFFDNLPHAAILKSKYLFLHGGIPCDVETLDNIANAKENYPQHKWLEEILWSDPVDGIEGVKPSPRGAGKIFGEDITRKILSKFNVKTIIRGHEPCSGVKVNHHGLVLTVFSRKGEPYYNAAAAYLKISGGKNAVDGYKLAEVAVKF